MPIDPRKQQIFEAWYDYDHAANEEEKGLKKRVRNDLIRHILEETNSSASVSYFLHCFREAYIEWQHGSGYRKGSRRF